MRKGQGDVSIGSAVSIQHDLELDTESDYAFMLDLDKTLQI